MSRYPNSASLREERLFVVKYEDGRTAYCVIPLKLLNTRRAGPLASAYTFAVEAQQWGTIPKGKIVEIVRAH